MRTRFAPSPNGPLHLGHAYAAIVAHDTAKARDGEFILRIEDIDGDRSRAQFVAEFLLDLAWLGLAWDGEAVFQSHRLASFSEAGERLNAMGLLYPCTCTRAEIAAAATQFGPDGPVYPGTCRHREIDPRNAAWRLDVGKAMALAGPLEWLDENAGLKTATPQIFGDVVLLRKDLPASYHLAATLDDATDGITLVTRGMDLFPASHVHRLLQALLDLPVPTWLHHPLLIEADGRKLAKRRGAPSLADRRRAGEDGHAIAEALRNGVLPAGLSFSQGVHHAP
ncbi:tRNA glutamyl-Q(34) synthetase GluQRS [Novosphingobium resinovorum]|uniref:tRNA glutamyl-Q(34) synthetase GluQRS n=1 Tax=Novosphingobium resinovorum TaxID=158500 RepID=UPI002ED4C945|nr:tRNA glutamyl-Q(34) synthetase GluQRS [Novosphingobium resinovorum]